MPEKLAKIWSFLFLFLLGGAGVLYILPDVVLRAIFAFLLLIVLAWVLRSRNNTDINTLALITAYVISVAQFGLHFYFRLSGWLILFVSFLWVGLMFWLGFQVVTGRISGSLKVMSLTAGLIGGQVALALVFWPVHFLVISTVFFLIFYLAWMVTYFYLTGLLNVHRILIHTVFVSVVLAIVLLTARWQI